ncbi:MAG: ATP-binding protein [Muribaculaceae bacterium]|nr:ATP-binding protein [Muribaculaceae bacterium]
MEKKRMVKYPIGEQSFESLREGNFIYVDKTRYIEKIVNGSQYYFLGRPRRFGKSLFLSTMKCFFEGKRELFKGLYIDTIDWDWEPYPVLHLDLNNQQYKEENNLDILIENFLSIKEKEYDITPAQQDHSVRFSNLIKGMYEATGKRVVILVDEYDKPLVNNIHNRDRFEMYRDKLATIYSNFKSSAEYIRLVFLTGVSRFGKLSVFSGLNNISDISFDIDFAAICGITEMELKENFKEGIDNLAQWYERTPEEEFLELKLNYDGYHFTEKSPDIYNPFSILQVLGKRQYDNYWISSGTPTLLVEQLKRTDTDLTKFLNIRCGRNALRGLDIDNISPESLFYQTGYLTIKDYDPRRQLYRLGLPNIEVKQGFFEFLLPYYSNLRTNDVRVFVFDFLDEMEEGRVEAFMKRLEAMFAGIGYDMKFDEERNVQNAFLILFSLIGLNVDAEVRTSDGRIDILVRTRDYVYIMELKYDGTPEEALEQIERKEYALPWDVDNRNVIEIGINYSSEKRRIDGWKAKGNRK